VFESSAYWYLPCTRPPPSLSTSYSLKTRISFVGRRGGKYGKAKKISTEREGWVGAIRGREAKGRGREDKTGLLAPFWNLLSVSYKMYELFLVSITER